MDRGTRRAANVDKNVPQRLKPKYKCGIYGTAEAVPLMQDVEFVLGGLEGGEAFIDHEAVYVDVKGDA
jgi:hypothetical protein